MSPEETVRSVWKQVMEEGKQRVELDGHTYAVKRSSRKNLRMVAFEAGGKSWMGIEQNPRTSSRWAKLARQGKQVMQFRCGNRYAANVCDGKLFRYPAWDSLDLKE